MATGGFEKAGTFGSIQKVPLAHPGLGACSGLCEYSRDTQDGLNLSPAANFEF